MNPDQTAPNEDRISYTPYRLPIYIYKLMREQTILFVNGKNG